MAADPKFTTARYPRPVLLDDTARCVYCGHAASSHDPAVPECAVYFCGCKHVIHDMPDAAEVDF